MGKADRNRRMNAREKIAVQQASAKRADTRRRMLLTGGSVLGVIAIVVVMIVIKGLQGTPASAGTSSGSPAQLVTAQLATVPATTLNAVGKGDAAKLLATKRQPMLASGIKPEVLFMGEESCPYCAAERWAITVALSRLGTFSNLHLIHSSSTDVYPNTPTVSFYKSSYTSKYVAFDPVEMYSDKTTSNGGYATLQRPTAVQSALMAKYDSSLYYPFVDIGNQYLVIGAQYLPSTLAGLTWAQVASDVRNPASPVAQGVDGAANSITAAICKITKNAPAAVCNSAAAKAGAGLL
jgi:Domain of unknown function (DUF929)